MQKLSILKKLMADVDPYVKKVQIFCVTCLIGLSLASTAIPSLMTNKYVLLGLGGLVLVIVITAFTARVEATIESGVPLTLQSIKDDFSGLASEFAEVKELIKNPPKTIQEAIEDVNKLAPEVDIKAIAAPAASAQPPASDIESVNQPTTT